VTKETGRSRRDRAEDTAPEWEALVLAWRTRNHPAPPANAIHVKYNNIVCL